MGAKIMVLVLVVAVFAGGCGGGGDDDGTSAGGEGAGGSEGNANSGSDAGSGESIPLGVDLEDLCPPAVLFPSSDSDSPDTFLALDGMAEVDVVERSTLVTGTTVSPDGCAAAVNIVDGPTTAYTALVRTETGEAIPLPEAPEELAWSPDATMLAIGVAVPGEIDHAYDVIEAEGAGILASFGSEVDGDTIFGLEGFDTENRVIFEMESTYTAFNHRWLAGTLSDESATADFEEIPDQDWGDVDRDLSPDGSTVITAASQVGLEITDLERSDRRRFAFPTERPEDEEFDHEWSPTGSHVLLRTEGEGPDDNEDTFIAREAFLCSMSSLSCELVFESDGAVNCAWLSPTVGFCDDRTNTTEPTEQVSFDIDGEVTPIDTRWALARPYLAAAP